jgi:glutamine---fructose-6-phosphate transaminase (isomerizing)
MTYISAELNISPDFFARPDCHRPKGFAFSGNCKKSKVYDSMMDTLTNIKNELNRELMMILVGNEGLDMAVTTVNLPEGIPEWLSPLVSTVPAQLFAYHLTCIKGNDPDNPRIIHKVTETKLENF